MRSIIENRDLPYARRWEAIRCGYFRRMQWPERAEECKALANHYGDRLLKETGVFVERIE